MGDAASIPAQTTLAASATVGRLNIEQAQSNSDGEVAKAFAIRYSRCWKLVVHPVAK